MTHKKEFTAGQLTIHYKATTISGKTVVGGIGLKATQAYLFVGGLRCQNGQMDAQEAIDYFTNIKKELEAEKYGYKR